MFMRDFYGTYNKETGFAERSDMLTETAKLTISPLKICDHNV